MRCHEVLGIDERATVSDIMLAYESKKTSLTDEHTSVSAEQIQAKLCELNSAKDNCMDKYGFCFENGKPRKRVFCGLFFSESS